MPRDARSVIVDDDHGRVLCAVGMGTNVSEAQRAAYALCEQIEWNGVQYRRDIGYRAIAREELSG